MEKLGKKQTKTQEISLTSVDSKISQTLLEIRETIRELKYS